MAAGDALLAPWIERHRAWVAMMWGRPCAPDAHRGLAAMYNSHPDFRARYEAIAPGFADYLAAAIQTAAS